MRLNKKEAVKKRLAKQKGRKKEDPLWPFVKERFETGKELRKPFEERWLLNLSFIGGKQYTFFNRSAQILQQIVARKGRIRVTDNKILPRYRKQVSRLIRNRPKMTVVPNTNEQEDIEAANLGTKVLESFWRNDKMQGKTRTLGGWIYATGNGFLDDRWDPKKGPIRMSPEGKLVYAGDATCGVWSPFEVLVPSSGLGDTEFHEFPWMMKHKFRELSYYERYGAKGKLIMPEDRKIMQADTSTVLGINLGPSSDSVPGAMEMQLYVQPCSEHPEGLFVIAANGIVLHKDKYPFDFYHMEHFKDVEIPGIFWGMATTEAAIWLQKLWNRTFSDIAEFNRTMGRGKWLVPRGTNMQADPDDTHGQKLVYTPKMGFKPEHLTLKGLPTSYQQVINIIAQSFMELYYQHEVTSGTNKSDIRSGEMVSLLLEQDDMGNIPTHAVFEEGMEAVFSRVLRRIQKGYDSARAIQIAGRGSEFQVLSFQGADLRGNTDVHVTKESSLPDSRVARQNTIMNRFDKGLYGDPMDPEIRRQVLSLLEDSVVDNIHGDVYLDEVLSRLENNVLKTRPKRLLINIYDSHDIHIKEHNKFRKSYDYQKLKRSEEPQDQKIFLMLEAVFSDHVGQHRKIIEQQKQQQLMEMARAQAMGKGV